MVLFKMDAKRIFSILFSFQVLQRLSSIDHRYKELLELSKLRKQRLLDALSLYKLFSESDGVEQWIGEKVRDFACRITVNFYSNYFVVKS